jgi:FkbM family methyltransferase
MTSDGKHIAQTIDVGALEDQATALMRKAIQVIEAGIAQAPDEQTRGRLRQRQFGLLRRLEPTGLWASQAGQDRWLEENVFKGKRNGVFAEVGAFDGINGSNTWFFETFRAWRGLLIEPSPYWAATCRSHRVVPCLQAAAGGEVRSARFLEVERGYTQMGGLVDSYDEGLMDRVKQDPRYEGREIEVAVRPLGDMLIEHGMTQVDYLSLDVEGAEIEVLRAFPFDRISVTAWSVENHGDKPEIAEIMERAGYVRARRIGEDDIWVRP